METKHNVADLGTREATVAQVAAGSDWQTSQAWMHLPKGQMPIKMAAQVTLTSEEKRQAATELRANDVRGHQVNFNGPVVSARYAHSRYLIDPCKYSWSKVVRIVALAMKFVAARRSAHQLSADQKKGTCLSNEEEVRVVSLAPDEVAVAEDYFFCKATGEVKQFVKLADYERYSEERNGVLYFTGCQLSSGGIKALETVMFDLSPVSFCWPIVDRHSPVAYAIML